MSKQIQPARMHFLLQELDWGTPLHRIRHRDHWRVYLIAVAGTLLAFTVWHALFPGTLWFYRLWGALATGGSLGTLVGCGWQLTDASRRVRSSGCHLKWSVIGGVGVLCPLAVFLLGPILRSQEMELARIRTLSVTDVTSVSVQASDQPEVKVMSQAALASFVNKCRAANLFYPSHERFTNKSRLAVNFVDGTAWTYEAGIPVNHQTDIVLSFRSYVGYSHILIPNAAQWIAGSKRGQRRGDHNRSKNPPQKVSAHR